ncbi:sigma-70 family RNA polymerase sigma factor [Teredinibacter haidensis]|uniref:sigma-70 family RNA polymerase sigma factor n=1 Tax=Teredinibacter haidensis TaxID=2731755 RepID=UPI000948D82F|nr:sigma-70 family RNA polymerase sigma factor [Teredinibacter haidensis]
MESNETKQHYSIGEAEELLADISDDAYRKMILSIEQLNPHRAGSTAEDLFELALEKVLAGDRKWPKSVKCHTFIRNVVRSLIWSIVKSRKDALSQATALENIDDISDLDLTADLRNDEAVISKAVHALMDAFKGDQSITCIILNKLKGFKATKIKEICTLTENSYQAAVKKLKRNARKMFPAGIDYWRDEQ